MAELKPCPFCGNIDIRMVTTMTGCDIWCNKCNVSLYRPCFNTPTCLADVTKDAQPKAVRAWNRRTTIETNIYDKEETYPNCTVQVLTNTVTGDVSVGWWENGGKEDAD